MQMACRPKLTVETVEIQQEVDKFGCVIIGHLIASLRESRANDCWNIPPKVRPQVDAIALQAICQGPIFIDSEVRATETQAVGGKEIRSAGKVIASRNRFALIIT